MGSRFGVKMIYPVQDVNLRCLWNCQVETWTYCSGKENEELSWLLDINLDVADMYR